MPGQYPKAFRWLVTRRYAHCSSLRIPARVRGGAAILWQDVQELVPALIPDLLAFLPALANVDET